MTSRVCSHLSFLESSPGASTGPWCLTWLLWQRGLEQAPRILWNQNSIRPPNQGHQVNLACNTSALRVHLPLYWSASTSKSWCRGWVLQCWQGHYGKSKDQSLSHAVEELWATHLCVCLSEGALCFADVAVRLVKYQLPLTHPVHAHKSSSIYG